MDKAPPIDQTTKKMANCEERCVATEEETYADSNVYFNELRQEAVEFVQLFQQLRELTSSLSANRSATCNSEVNRDIPCEIAIDTLSKVKEAFLAGLARGMAQMQKASLDVIAINDRLTRLLANDKNEDGVNNGGK